MCQTCTIYEISVRFRWSDYKYFGRKAIIPTVVQSLYTVNWGTTKLASARYRACSLYFLLFFVQWQTRFGCEKNYSESFMWYTRIENGTQMAFESERTRKFAIVFEIVVRCERKMACNKHIENFASGIIRAYELDSRTRRYVKYEYCIRYCFCFMYFEN